MSNRIALVTGAAGGIGSAMVTGFMEAGWQVVAVDRQPCSKKPKATLVLQEDVSDPAAATRIFEEVSSRFARLDALVNNAAIQLCKPIAETTAREWDDVMASNVRSAFLMIRNALPLLRGGGAIVNVSSVHAAASSPDIAAYAASKGALLALTRALAVELAPEQIRVNALLPGAVDTPMLRAGLARSASGAEESLKVLEQRIVLGRVGQPDELVPAALFLADSSCSSYMSGQSLVIDGGVLSRLSSE